MNLVFKITVLASFFQSSLGAQPDLVIQARRGAVEVTGQGRRPILASFFQSALAAQPDLVIQVLRGGGGNNNAVTGNAASPVVRVVNSQGAPITGALVVFSAPPGGASVEFAGAGATAQAFTDESGAAAAPHIRPVGSNGQVEIRVMATKEGRTANTSITQINLGLDGAAESPNLLEIIALPGPPASASREVSFRVQNGAGQAVPGARVLITVNANRHGKFEEIGRFDQTSGPDGRVTINEKNPAHEPLDVTVRASQGSRNATRYFTLE